MCDVNEYLQKWNKLPKVDVDAFGEDRGVVKGHGGKEGGSYRFAARNRRV